MFWAQWCSEGPARAGTSVLTEGDGEASAFSHEGIEGGLWRGEHGAHGLARRWRRAPYSVPRYPKSTWASPDGTQTGITTSSSGGPWVDGGVVSGEVRAFACRTCRRSMPTRQPSIVDVSCGGAVASSTASTATRSFSSSGSERSGIAGEQSRIREDLGRYRDYPWIRLAIWRGSVWPSRTGSVWPSARPVTVGHRNTNEQCSEPARGGKILSFKGRDDSARVGHQRLPHLNPDPQTTQSSMADRPIPSVDCES